MFASFATKGGVRPRPGGPELKEQELLKSGQRLLLDTNAFIYFLEGVEPYLSVLVPLFDRVWRGELTVVVSAVTEAELLVRPMRQRDEVAVDRITDLLSEDGFEVVDVDRRIARRAARLRTENRLSLTDAMIVATAIEAECEAAVGNDREWAKRMSEIPYMLLDGTLQEHQLNIGRQSV